MVGKILWELKKNGVIYMPLTTTRLKRWISEGRVNKDDPVWHSGFSGWKKAGDVKELRKFFGKSKKKKSGSRKEEE
ncbi:MAG: DUF4339 domain-containing protein [Thermoplasmatales archaeon]|nr:DUF4339 domain-containing protein [Thermoplasmatales archaeon]